MCVNPRIPLAILCAALALAGADRIVRAEAADALSSESIAGGSSDASVLDRYVLQGGWITLFGLVPLSVAAVAVMLQFSLQTRRAAILPRGLLQQLKDLFATNQYADVIHRVADERSVLGDVLHRGLTAAREGVQAMEQTMEEGLEEHAVRLHRKLEYLNLIGSVAPMIGLFGTVHGIIGMFVPSRMPGESRSWRGSPPTWEPRWWPRSGAC